MGVYGFAWISAWRRRRPGDRLGSREVSLVRTDTRSLIRIANEVDLATSPEPKDGQRPASHSAEQLRSLAVAEGQLANSIADAALHGLSVQELERDVIKPILFSTVIVSNLAREALRRVVRVVSAGPQESP